MTEIEKNEYKAFLETKESYFKEAVKNVKRMEISKASKSLFD